MSALGTGAQGTAILGSEWGGHAREQVLGFLRDTQNYVHLAARGLTLWDVAPSRVERDLEQWQPLIDWVNAP